MTSEEINDPAKAEREPLPSEDPTDAPVDASEDDAGGSATVRAVTTDSLSFERRGGAWIGAAGSIVAACIVAWGAYHVADVFQPSFVRLENVLFNMRHIVEIVDTANGCSVIMTNSSGVVSDGEQYFSSHALDLAGCLSLHRAVEKHTVSGIGRVTRGEIFLSGLAQAYFITMTGTCPDEMRRVPLGLSNGESTARCTGSVAFAHRLAEGPPWPESWKATGLIVPFIRGSCPEGMLSHSDHDDLLWCCFGLPTIGGPHPGHSSM